MAAPAVRAALLATLLFLAAAAAPAAVSGEEAGHEEALLAKIRELERLAVAQKDRIRRLEQHTEERKLSTQVNGSQVTPSIYNGSQALANTRVYTSDENLQGGLTHMWLIICGALVFFMQAGFAMVHAGSCRMKNMQAILLQSLIGVTISTLGWWLVGWSFAYSGPYNSDGNKEAFAFGYEEFAGHNFLVKRSDHQQEPTAKMSQWFFTWGACIMATTIMNGGLVERVSFPACAFYSVCMSCGIYPIVVGLTKGNGWLAAGGINGTGFSDFAGGGTVHLTGGIAALIGAMLAGPRFRRFKNLTVHGRVHYTPEEFMAHNVPLICFGTFILWFGWYGLTCGSTMNMNNIESGMLAAQIAMNTTIAASAGGITVLLLRSYVMGMQYDIAGFCNGVLAGLVSISAACGSLECGSAFAVAIVGAFIFQGTSSLIRVLNIDDPVDAFAVHGASGCWGLLAACFFDWGKEFTHVHAAKGFRCIYQSAGSPDCKSDIGVELIAANIVMIILIIIWVVSISSLLFLPLTFVTLVRPTGEAEEIGFDERMHAAPRGYDLEEVYPKACI